MSGYESYNLWELVEAVEWKAIELSICMDLLLNDPTYTVDTLAIELRNHKLQMTIIRKRLADISQVIGYEPE